MLLPKSGDIETNPGPNWTTFIIFFFQFCQDDSLIEAIVLSSQDTILILYVWGNILRYEHWY